MLVKYKLNGKVWLWVNVPKTATTSTMKAIFPDKPYNSQEHYTYRELINRYQDKYDVFTMVRHPIDRFMSGLNHIFSVCECKQCKFDLTVPPKTEEVIAFLGDMLKLKSKQNNFFDTVYKNSTNKLYLEVIRSIQKHFNRNIRIGDVNINCVRWPLIIPQHYILNGLQRGRIFRYENLDVFFKFVTYELGYQIPVEKYRNYDNKLVNVDFNNSTLRHMIYELHKDDFINYDYSL